MEVKESGGEKTLSIKDWAEEDRPREKMMARGAGALTSAELLAIIIGSGNRHQSAVELMTEILRDCNHRLSNLNKMTLEALQRYEGIGPAKALSIMAAAEVGRRRAEESTGDMPCFTTAQDVMQYMRPKVQDLSHEESWVLLLNNGASLIRCVNLSSGGRTETCIDVRMLLKEALLSDATSFILVHNHPSGRVVPSSADKEMTKTVLKASQAVNVRMIDHVIVTDSADMSNYYSFAENGFV